jgi:hypothetical protein
MQHQTYLCYFSEEFTEGLVAEIEGTALSRQLAFLQTKKQN